MCVALYTQYFPESCKQKSQAYYSGGIRTHDPLLIILPTRPTRLSCTVLFSLPLMRIFLLIFMFCRYGSSIFTTGGENVSSRRNATALCARNELGIALLPATLTESLYIITALKIDLFVQLNQHNQCLDLSLNRKGHVKNKSKNLYCHFNHSSFSFPPQNFHLF